MTALVILGLGCMAFLLWPKMPTFTVVGTEGDTSLQTINSTSFGVNVTVIIEVRNDNRIDLNLRNIKADGFYYMLPAFPIAQVQMDHLRIPRNAITTVKIPIPVVYNMDRDPGGASGVDLVRSCGILGASLIKPLLGSYNVSIEAALLRFKSPVTVQIRNELNIACPFNVSTLPSVLDTVLPSELVNILMKTANNLNSVVGSVNSVTDTIGNTENTVGAISHGDIGGTIEGVKKTVGSVTDVVSNVGDSIKGIFG